MRRECMYTVTSKRHILVKIFPVKCLLIAWKAYFSESLRSNIESLENSLGPLKKLGCPRVSKRPLLGNSFGPPRVPWEVLWSQWS